MYTNGFFFFMSGQTTRTSQKRKTAGRERRRQKKVLRKIYSGLKTKREWYIETTCPYSRERERERRRVYFSLFFPLCIEVFFEKLFFFCVHRFRSEWWCHQKESNGDSPLLQLLSLCAPVFFFHFTRKHQQRGREREMFFFIMYFFFLHIVFQL